MSDSRRWPAGAWLAWLTSLGAWVSATWLMVAGRPPDEPLAAPAAVAIENFAYVAIATLSLLILRARPGHRVGRAAMLAGLFWPVEALVVEVAIGTAGSTIATAVWLGWVARWVWIPIQFALPLVLLYYPDGHLPSHRWRAVRPAMWAIAGLVFVTSATDPRPDDELGLANPLATDLPAAVQVLGGIAGVVIAYVLPVLGLVAVVSRHRRASPTERRQLRVVTWVGVVAVAYFAVTSVVPMGPVTDALVGTAFVVYIGASITTAIVRYRAFDIDRLISRSISYAVVLGLLTGAFFGVVFAVTSVLPVSNDPAVALATLAVAAAFNPLLRRVRRRVDKRFDRTAYEARQVMARFAVDIGSSVTLDELVTACTGAVTDALHPSTTSVWVDAPTRRAPG